MTDAEICAIYATGLTIEAVAARAAVGRETVRRALLRGNVVIRRNGPAFKPQSVRVPSDASVIGYLAGLFDGEGNVYWRRRTKTSASVRVTIYSTTAEVMAWLQVHFGGFVRWDNIRVKTKGWKPCARWEVNQKTDVLAIFSAILPFLIIKRSAVEDTIGRLREPPQ